jgi:hypothetical protein
MKEEEREYIFFLRMDNKQEKALVKDDGTVQSKGWKVQSSDEFRQGRRSKRTSQPTQKVIEERESQAVAGTRVAKTAVYMGQVEAPMLD